MGTVYQHDKRINVTYVYESEAWWDKDLKRSRAKRRLVGRLDPETGEVVPTDGRNRKAAERRAEEAKRPRYKQMWQEEAELRKRLEERVAELEAEVERLRSERG